MKPQSIRVGVKHVYGVVRYYPLSPEACVFCDLIGRKTLLPRDLALIEQLGFVIEKDAIETTIYESKS